MKHYILIDLETNALTSYASAKITRLSAYKVKNHKIIAKLNLYSTAYTIKGKSLNKLPHKKLLQKFATFIGFLPIITSNIDFDEPFINMLYMRDLPNINHQNLYYSIYDLLDFKTSDYTFLNTSRLNVMFKYLNSKKEP